MKLAIINLFIGIFSCLPAYCQWEPANGPSGGEVTDILTIGQYIFLNAGAGGIYRSEDGGDHWLAIRNGLPNNPHCYAIASTGTILYAAIYAHGIYKSIDFGASWTSSGASIAGRTFYSLLADGNDIYAGDSEGGFFRSGNGGTSWTRKGNQIGQVRNFLIAGGNLFVAATNSFGAAAYKSTDKGDNLINLYAPVTSINLMTGYDNAIYITGGQPTKISRDYGATWTSSDIGTNGHYMLNSGHAYENKVIIPGGNSTVFLSDDEGLTWQTINNLPYAGVVVSVYREDDMIIIGGREGIYLSSDNGTSWSEKNEGLNNLIITQLLATDDILFAGTGIGIFSSMDNGITWEKRNNGLHDTSTSGYIEGVVITGIHAHSNDLTIATSTGIFKSYNNGVSWELKQNLQLTDLNNRFYALAGDKEKLFAAQKGQQYYSVSKGETWAALNDPIFDSKGIYKAIVKGDTIIVLTDNDILITKNFGNSWQSSRVSTSYFTPNDAVFLDEDLYVATSQGLFVCEFPGTSWKKVVGLPTESVLSLFVRNGALYAGTDMGLHVAHGMGFGWSPLNEGLTDVFMKPITFNSTHCFAGTYGASVWRSAWTDLNVKPRITGLSNQLELTDDHTIEINLGNLKVSDPDNNFPQDFTLTIKPGADYTIAGNVITLQPDYSGFLQIPLVVNDGRSDSNEYIVTVNVKLITGIPESDAFEFFPNPANQKINFKITEDINSYSLLDVAGRIVTNQKNTFNDNGTFSLDVSDLPSGVYFLELHGKKTRSHRFVKY
jgi:photosystem II stability/assembly factor-like uncharacterized protein